MTLRVDSHPICAPQDCCTTHLVDRRITVLAFSALASLSAFLTLPWDLAIPLSALFLITGSIVALAMTPGFLSSYDPRRIIVESSPPLYSPHPVFIEPIATPIYIHEPRPFVQPFSWGSHHHAPVGTREICHPAPRFFSPTHESNRAPVGYNGIRAAWNPSTPRSTTAAMPAYHTAARAPVGRR